MVSSGFQNVQLDDRIYRVTSTREGGMGRVWLLELAHDYPDDTIYRRRVAVKTFNSEMERVLIERELNHWVSLSHRHVLPLRKIGRLNYRLAAIMPMMKQSLGDLLEARGSLTDVEVIGALTGVADALDYAWTQHRILHLDLKPSNVLLEGTDALHTRVADWGISRIASHHSTSEAGVPSAAMSAVTRFAAGTVPYMAPERFTGRWTLAPSADIYSLGMMLVELCTGVLPFPSNTQFDFEAVLEGDIVENAAAIMAERDAVLRQLCIACLAPEPGRRPQYYRDIRQMLQSAAKRR